MDCNNGIGLDGMDCARELDTHREGMELVEAFGGSDGNFEIVLGGSQLSKKNYRPFPAYIPADGQSCYVVRFQIGSPAIPATFNLADWTFTTAASTVPIPGWAVVEWKPAS